MKEKLSLEDIVNDLNKTGWSSAKKIAKHLGFQDKETKEALEKLVADEKIKKRVKGRGHQYGPLNPISKETKPEPKVPDLPAPPSDTVFASLDEFMLNGIRALPKDKSFNADDFGKELIKAYPGASWTETDVVKNIAKLVRLGRLGLHPYTEDSRLKYQYYVK